MKNLIWTEIINNKIKTSNMKNLNLKALGTSLLLTGGTLFVATLAALLIKYANPTFLFVFVVLLLIVFFYIVFKD